MRIAIVADYDATSKSHLATEAALKHSAAKLGCADVMEVEWLRTDLVQQAKEAGALERYDALWIGPGSPYASMEGALEAIRFGRERNVPLLGTCGGFQHSIIESARNVLGITNAEHEETAPGAPIHFIHRLTCSLVGRAKIVHFREGSHLREIYGCASREEEYLCNFGVNPARVEDVERSGLRVVASDDEGTVPAIEIPSRRFFIATLFLPQHRSTALEPHPLISAFVGEAAKPGAL